MTVRYERPVSHSAYFARRLSLLSFVMFILAWGLHRFGPLETPYFLAIALVCCGLSLVALYLAMIGVFMLWTKGARGGKAALHAILLAALPLAPALAATARYMTLPEVYDVTSDLADPPKWISEASADQLWLGKRAPPAKADRDAQIVAYADIQGRRYEGALDRVYTAALKVAHDTGIAVTEERGAPDLQAAAVPVPKSRTDEAVPDALDNIPIPLPRPDNDITGTEEYPVGDAYIQGVHRTFVFGLRQDVVIRLREEAETTLVDVRVASRYGKHDLGTGADFMTRYLRALDAELLGIAGD